MRDNGDVAVRVRLLGPFSVVSGGRAAGPWPRPSARRLCQLVLVSPGRRVSRDLACEELFPELDPRAAARSVSKALSMARAALAGLGEPAASLLEADLTRIWANPAVEVDAAEHEHALRAALALGLSPWLEEVYATAAYEAGPPRTQATAREELRTVSVLAAEVAVDGPGDPEERRDVTGRCLAAVIAEVEALGGTVTSVSGGGLQAMFGAPEAHEDDPERAARAAFRALSAVAAIDGGTLRIGVETGPAVLGPIGGGARVEYGAVGEV